MEAAAYESLKILWDYMHMNLPLRRADCIVGFGSYSDSVAVRAAELYRQDYAPKLLFSGGLGRNTEGRFATSEAERFCRIAVAEGVPREDILLEDKSTNTGENILFTKRRFEELGMRVTSILAVHKPFMERRIYAALRAYWPEVELSVTSPRQTIEAYIRDSARQGLEERTAIDVIVGDFQRMEVYARLGYQIPQPIPAEVREAFLTLTRLGYTSQLVPSR